MVDWDEAASSVIDALGDEAAATYEGANGSTEIRGVLSRGYQRVEGSRGPALNSKRVEFSIVKSELGFEAQQGDQLTVQDVLYTVASIQPDAEDTQLTLGLKRV